MAFMLEHQKLGGRQKDTLNKKTNLKASELLLRLNIKPIQKLVELAEPDEATIDHKINCYKEIAKYTYPKYKTQELPNGELGRPQSVQIRLIETCGKVTDIV